MSAPVATPRGPAELGAAVRRADGAGAELPRCVLPSCPHPRAEGDVRCALHIAADPPTSQSAPPSPLSDAELSGRLSEIIATARSYARRYDAGGAHRRAQDYAALERAADVLLTSERLQVHGFVVAPAPESAWLQSVHALGPRLGGSVGRGRTGGDEAFDDIADAAVRIIRRRVRQLLGVVA